jgi:hypothetical protein
LDQPLDAETERLLIRAADMVGYQVIVTEDSDCPLSIDTADLADFDLSEATRVDQELRLLLIDGQEITFIRAPETWSQTLHAKTKEGGSIAGGMKKACTLILSDWAKK